MQGHEEGEGGALKIVELLVATCVVRCVTLITTYLRSARVASPTAYSFPLSLFFFPYKIDISFILYKFNNYSLKDL